MADSQPQPQIAPCDALRNPEQAIQPDARYESFAVIDAGEVRKVALADRHEAISGFVLNPTVPASIRIHFETAKNLYLYGWFVYRFHPVAEQQALASLEFALRERLAQMDSTARGTAKRSGLTGLLKQARMKGLISNDALRGRSHWAAECAHARYHFELYEEMNRTGATEMAFDDSGIQPTQEDLNLDWIAVFIESLPMIRNTYAHGSEMLYPTVLRTFDVVSDLINQLYPKGN